MHANVGGGYPDDSLAQIPLYWIMQEAKACGLRFKPANPEAVAETKEAQDKDGRLYDSRSGTGAYYRYGPRRVSKLCNQIFSNTTGDAVHVAAPKIHDSVFKRIKNNAHVYAPIGIPHDYELVVTVPKPNSFDADFRIDPLPAAANASAYETVGDAQARVLAERSTVWPRVYWRGLLYLLTLLATAALVVFPFVADSNDIADRQNQVSWLSYIIRTLAGFLPGWASSWLTSYSDYPITFVVLAAIVIVLMILSSKAAAAITDRMARLWTDALTHATPTPATPPTSANSGAEKVLFGIRSAWKDYFAPALFAIVIVYVGFSFVNRGLFTALDQAGLVCMPTDPAPNKVLPDIPDKGALFSFDVRSPCFSTGYRVGRLDRYLVWTTPDINELNTDPKYKGYKLETKCTLLTDNTLLNRTVRTNARGYNTFFNSKDEKLKGWWTELDPWQIAWNALLLPFKRHYGEPWFRPVARYGEVGAELDFLEPDPDAKVTKISEVVVPKVPSELFFYYNDAVVGLRWHWAQVFYQDNSGCATVFVMPR